MAKEINIKQGEGIVLTPNSSDHSVTISSNTVVGNLNENQPTKAPSVNTILDLFNDKLIAYKKDLPPGDINTGAYWRALPPGIYQKNGNLPALTNQLTVWGLILILAIHPGEKTIIWHEKSHGAVWITGVNGSTETVRWDKLVYESQLKPTITKFKVGDVVISAS